MKTWLVNSFLLTLFSANFAGAETLCAPVQRDRGRYIARSGVLGKVIIPLNADTEKKLKSLKGGGETVCFEGTLFTAGSGFDTSAAWFVYSIDL